LACFDAALDYSKLRAGHMHLVHAPLALITATVSLPKSVFRSPARVSVKFPSRRTLNGRMKKLGHPDAATATERSRTTRERLILWKVPSAVAPAQGMETTFDNLPYYHFAEGANIPLNVGC
jgi:hypothetical protein